MGSQKADAGQSYPPQKVVGQGEVSTDLIAAIGRCLSSADLRASIELGMAPQDYETVKLARRMTEVSADTHTHQSLRRCQD